MDFLEKDLEEIIYNADKDKLADSGLYLMFKLKRQLRIGKYGIADLIHYRRPYYHPNLGYVCKGYIEIIELKNKKIGVSTFFQAINYLQGIKSYLEKRGVLEHYDFYITLIGREVDVNSSFCYLSNIFYYDNSEKPIIEQSAVTVSLYKYVYSLNGIEFKEINGYQLKNEGF